MSLTLVDKLASKTPRVEARDGGSDAPAVLIFKVIEITFDSSYATGGESLTASDCGLGAILTVICGAATGRVFEYDYTNAKLIAYQDAATAIAMAQVPNTTDLSAVVVRALVVGTAV